MYCYFNEILLFVECASYFQNQYYLNVIFNNHDKILDYVRLYYHGVLMTSYLLNSVKCVEKFKCNNKLKKVQFS